MKNILLFVFFISYSFVILAGTKGVLYIAENETPENLDPANATNSTVDQLLVGVYDTLVQFTAGETAVTPRIAKSWKVSGDGKKYTFNLRSDVLFHDGSSLTAKDVKFTLDRLVSAKGNTMNDLAFYKGAEIVDDYTINLLLEEPFGPFISGLSRIYIINKKLVQANMGDDNARAWLAVNEAGSGPYKITKYKPTEEVVFEAFKPYWKGWDGNHVSKVVFVYISEPATQLALLKAGDIHIAPDLTVDDKVKLRGQSGFKVDIGAAATPLYFQLNTQGKKLMKNKLFRKALVMSFDRNLHLKNVLQGFGNMPDGPLPSNWPGHEKGTELKFDLNSAKKIIKDNGWTGTKLLVRYLPAIEEEKRAVEQFQSNLAKIGITLDTEGMTWPSQAATVQKLETTSDINMIYNFPSFPDPHAILNTSFNGKLTGYNGGYNWAQYSNSKVDTLLNKAASSSDQNQRAKLYSQVQKIVGSENVVITVSNPGSVVALSSKVEGYKYNVAHHQTFNYMDIGLK
jgi:peptide/nickel transport system substrate-binding protein